MSARTVALVLAQFNKEEENGVFKRTLHFFRKIDQSPREESWIIFFISERGGILPWSAIFPLIIMAGVFLIPNLSSP